MGYENEQLAKNIEVKRTRNTVVGTAGGAILGGLTLGPLGLSGGALLGGLVGHDVAVE